MSTEAASTSSHEQILKVLDEVKALTLVQVESTKLRISFMEKLIVLDGATLALSMSTYSTLSAHMAGDGGRGYLLASWKVMLVAIAFALLSQLLTIWGTDKFNVYAAGHRLSTIIAFMERDKAEVTSTRMRDRADKSMKWSGPLLKGGYVFGFTALITSVVAFYWLYCFLRSDLPLNLVRTGY